MTDRITNEELIIEIEKSKRSGKITNRLGKVFVFIANYYTTNPKFKHLTYKEDMKAAAIHRMMESYVKFDPTKSDNPFGYLVTVTRCSNSKYLNSELKEQHEQYND